MNHLDSEKGIEFNIGDALKANLFGELARVAEIIVKEKDPHELTPYRNTRTCSEPMSFPS